MLQYASTALDFVFGIGLYLSSSHMALHPGNVQSYINEIIIAKSDAVIGHNPGIKESEPPQAPSNSTFKGKIAPPAGTIQRGPQGPTLLAEKVTHVASQHAAELRAQALQQVKARAHEGEKLALVTGGIALWPSSTLVVCVCVGGGGVSQSRAATRSRVATAMAMTYKFSSSHVAVFPKVFRGQETIEPMIQGRASAALPAKLARARPRAWRCFSPTLSNCSCRMAWEMVPGRALSPNASQREH